MSRLCEVLTFEQKARSLGTALEDLDGCVSETSLDELVAAIKAEFAQTVKDVVKPLQRQTCLDAGRAFDESSGECLVPPLGTSPSNPATSCRALLAEEHGKTSGDYYIKLPGANIEPVRTYCDQTRYRQWPTLPSQTMSQKWRRLGTGLENLKFWRYLSV